MMKRLLFIIALFIGFASQAQVKVLGYMMPNHMADKYPTHIDTLGQGGLMTMRTAAERDDIPVLRRKEGMLVYVADSVKFYQLQPDLVSWLPFTSSGETTNFTEVDPAFFAHIASTITASDIERWNQVSMFDTIKIYFNGDDFIGQATYEDPIGINHDLWDTKYERDSAIAANLQDQISPPYKRADSVFTEINNEEVFLFVDEAGGGGGGDMLVTKYIVRETPTGSVNGTNTIFTLAFLPVSGKEMVFRNGVLQELTSDYTISSSSITFTSAPLTGDLIRVTYYKQ